MRGPLSTTGGNRTLLVIAVLWALAGIVVVGSHTSPFAAMVLWVLVGAVLLVALRLLEWWWIALLASTGPGRPSPPTFKAISALAGLALLLYLVIAVLVQVP